MRDDALPDGPGPVPRKRRQLERVLDVQLALWLAGDELTPSERRRVEAEKQRRKTAPEPLPVAVVLGHEGMTPTQREVISNLLTRGHGARPTEIHHNGSRAVHALAKLMKADSVRHWTEDDRDIIKAAEWVIAAPKEKRSPVRPRGVWATVRYARDRGLPVAVVTPDGNVDERGES